MLFMGIDAGTQGARCVVAGETGTVAAAASASYKNINVSDAPGRYEQTAGDWWAAVESVVKSCVLQIKNAGHSAGEIAAVSVDGTSGTVIPLDKNYRPLHNALMYNDARASVQADAARAAMGGHERKMGHRINASFSLPRILWIRDNLPDLYEKTAVFAHHADYIAGRLCGEFTVSDYSNALKTGYDLIDERWPDEIADKLHIDTSKLPRIVAPGASIAHVDKNAARSLGLSEKTMVTGGSTDGYASALAAGANKPGSWASVIGTTFVLKGVTEQLIIDLNGGSYSHKLPSGHWALGGASNVGGRCLDAFFPDGDFAARDEAAWGVVPTGVRCYPLIGAGERFPFTDPGAEAFYAGDISGGKLYAALMEGVGFAERLAYERMADIGAGVGDTVFTAGGACRSAVWLHIRASILNKTLKVPETVDAAMGSAMLAAGGFLGGAENASAAMLRVAAVHGPDAALSRRYDEIYKQFRSECATKYKF